MQPPGFWSNPPDRPGVVARGLVPLSALWSAVTARRVSRAPKLRADVPVICVGNLNIGGTGKTPVVCDLLTRLSARGIAAHALSRGYKGQQPGPLRVDIASHSARDVGDEPLLLAGFGPTWIARDRAAGARAAIEGGAQALVLDDGFQNPDIAKDLSILVIDAEAGFGNGRVIPAGPLREPVQLGLLRADLLVFLGAENAKTEVIRRWPSLAPIPQVRGELKPLLTGMPWQGLKCLAFAGIGRPEKFFTTLRATGADVLATRAFPDHAAYPDAILTRLMSEADSLGAQLVTTEKDAVRLPDNVRRRVLALPVRLHLDQDTALKTALDQLFQTGVAPA